MENLVSGMKLNVTKDSVLLFEMLRVLRELREQLEIPVEYMGDTCPP